MSTIPTEPRVTLAALAAEAGVSLATASKVLNGRPDVAAATRLRVESLLERNGYQRRAATTTRSRLIELVFHELESAWSMELIRGVESVASERGMSVVLTESGTRHAPGSEWLEGVLSRRPVGVVLVFSDLPEQFRSALAARSIPFVIVDPAGDPSPDVPAVGSANWAGGLAAVRHLIELGHRRIAAITGPEDMMCSLARIDGYRSAMNAAGLPIREEWIRFGDFHLTGGARHAADLLALDEPPTAIFAGSDLQALGVLETARTLGMRVPDDLSVVGYDDIPLASWVSPRLTTVHQPLMEMAKEATRLVIRLSEGQLASPPRMDLATSLVVRESTAALAR
ncbi:LacI family DNA-binding transcriptional regulator [Homoserinimonas hongtaonis]|uniref:LacI family transcriptional regulator n=1 Tax=Homoserinimonas hongtaonis TaxID=2079791 RepID=A0A2U1T0R6_9MICO|nr:LacI family DNA-binding transcriptional regulator [Salinibacterium hongtaonis]AWB89910.1 LacI family transcriptional regulator [Salinibacterium hongtaonis]PWB97373.1 LacI family transcriptional regulator [Salinibacterium hongtaonis]